MVGALVGGVAEVVVEVLAVEEESVHAAEALPRPKAQVPKQGPGQKLLNQGLLAALLAKHPRARGSPYASGLSHYGGPAYGHYGAGTRTAFAPIYSSGGLTYVWMLLAADGTAHAIRAEHELQDVDRNNLPPGCTVVPIQARHLQQAAT